MSVPIDKWLERQRVKKTKSMPWSTKLLMMLSGREGNRVAYQQFLQSIQQTLKQSRVKLHEMQRFSH